MSLLHLFTKENNLFTGTLPPQIGHMANLVTIDLGKCVTFASIKLVFPHK
jgi:hypothetical protein